MQNIIKFQDDMQAIILSEQLLSLIKKGEKTNKEREQAAIKQLEAQNGKKYGT